MDQQTPATNQRQRGTWTLATGLASKDMVELFAFTTVDMGLATLWWKLHLEHAGNIAGKLIGKMVENYGNWKLVEKWWKTKTVGKLIRPPVQHPHPQLHMRVNSEQLAEITFFSNCPANQTAFQLSMGSQPSKHPGFQAFLQLCWSCGATPGYPQIQSADPHVSAEMIQQQPAKS